MAASIRYGRPQHPSDLGAHRCATYLHRARREEWRFKNAQGEDYSITPTGQLRGTSIEAILPSVLAGMVLADLPEFTANQYIHDGRLEPIFTDWYMQDGGLHFVTPTTRARPAKVSALADFFISQLSGAEWRTPTIAPELWTKTPATRSRPGAAASGRSLRRRPQSADGL